MLFRKSNLKKHIRSRVRSFESLEVRRLMISEGAVLNISTPVDTAGLLGTASAQVDWGDGVVTNASIAGGNSTGNLKVVFNYSLDPLKFFGTSASDPRRIKLQQAADSLVSRFTDTLTAVTPLPFVTVRPKIFHPSQGPANSPAGTELALPVNPSIPANTIIIYAGARDLPGDARGVGGGAAISFTRTCIPGPQCVTAQANQDAIESRGQAGVLASPATDIAPLFASISFDAPSASQFYFGNDPDGIREDQIDFLSVATHELAHALGFGTSESWTRYVSGSTFTGPKAKAAYIGNGNVPIVPSHWAPAVVDAAGGGQASLMGPFINFGRRVPLSRLDFAALDDIGWDVANTSATVTASHRYADDGNYVPTVIVRGSSIGEVSKTIAAVPVTNLAPTLTVVGNQTSTVNQTFSITDIGTFTDPGFQNLAANPDTFETFTYSIDWGDGRVDTGAASIDVQGDANGRLTSGSFNGSHAYTTAGNKTVKVRVVDDNGGAAEKSFVVVVSAPPALSLTVNRTSFDENAGDNAATLTVSRSGPATGLAATINLTSTDTSEATVPASVVIPGDRTSVTVPVCAIDDALLDGSQKVTIQAKGTLVDSASIELTVNDVETLTATLSKTEVVENQAGTLLLTIRRSNTDTANALIVSIAGINSTELALPGKITIPVGAQQIAVPVDPIDDEDPEKTASFTLVFSAPSYSSTSVSFDLLDDEPPKFQNPVDAFDVSGLGGLTALDSLQIINQLARQSTPDLDPETQEADGVFYDVNGDYRVTALDALLVINELSRRRLQPPTTSSSLSGPSLSGPSLSGPSLSGPSLSGPSLSGPSLSGPSLAGESVDAVIAMVPIQWYIDKVNEEDDEVYADWRAPEDFR